MTFPQEFSIKHAEQLKKALTCCAEDLYDIFATESEEVIRAALKNVSLKQEHLHSLLHRHDLNSSIIGLICKHKLSESRELIGVLLAHPGIAPQQIRILLDRLYLLELLDISIMPGQAPDVRIAAEQCICKRLHTAPLGNRITLARRASYPVLEILMLQGHPQIVEPCLNNPRMKESAIFKHINSHNAGTQTLCLIARHPRWNKRRNIRRAILKNPYAPRALFVQFLPSLTQQETRQLLFSKRLKRAQKDWVREITGTSQD